MITAEAARAAVTALEAFSRAETLDAKEKSTRPVERVLARAIRRAFTSQRKAFLTHLSLTGAIAPTTEANVQRRMREAVARWDPAFDAAIAATNDDFTEPMQAALEAAMTAGGTWQTMGLGIASDFNLSNPRALAWISGRAADQVANINETTRAALSKIITNGLSKGDSYGKIAAAIRQTYDGWEVGANPPIPSFIADRAELIATTEVGQAYEAGSRSVVDDLAAEGLEMEKSFLCGGDNPCDECQDNEDAGWIPLDGDFPNDDAPVHPGCRCTNQYQRAETPDTGDD